MLRIPALALILSFSLVGLSYAAQPAATDGPSKERFCFYKGEQFSPGSIIEMNGSKKECRDNQYEEKAWRADEERRAEAKGEQIYLPFVHDDTVEWRKPI